MSVGENMKKRRKELGFNADFVADKLNVSRSTIFRYENGDIEKLPIDVVDRLAEILQTTPGELMGWESNNSNLTNKIKPSLVESIYNFSDADKEVLSLYNSLPDEGKDRWIRAGYDLQTEYQRRKGSKQSLLLTELIDSLTDVDDLAVRELARNSKWLYEQTGSLSSKDQSLLEDSLLLIESDKTKTAEFINLKRKIYEYILPLAYFVTASEKNIHNIKDISEQFNLSKEFVIDAILYYVTSRGSVIEDKKYLIDFNNIPLEYDDIEQVSKAEVVVINLEEEDKPKKKRFFKK
jgi:transcriptional regulator with XRE-family HTH domain